MHTRHELRRTLKARHLFLLLAIACGIALSQFSRFVTNTGSAQSEPPPVHEIAYERDEQIYIMKADGERQPRLLENAGPSVASPAWSHDSKRIAFNNPFGEEIIIWSADAGGVGERQVVTDPEKDPDGHHNYDAAYSPDGEQIAYSRYSFVDNVAHIYLISPSGGTPTQLFTGLTESFEAAWSPDGKMIAFASGTPSSSNEDIYIVAVDGSAPPIRLTQDAKGNRAPAFSPDGKKIAYSKGGDIYVINVDGTGETNLTNTPELRETDPSYSPDNARIAYSARTIGNPSFIYIMNVDGSNVVPTGEAGESPAWKPIPGLLPPPPPPPPTPTPDSDVAVRLTASHDTIGIGQNLTYTMVIRNNGPGTAEDIEASLIRSASLQLISATPGQGSCGPDGNPLRCQLGRLASGAQTSIQFIVRTTAGGEVVAFAGVTSTTPDTDSSNNSQRLELRVSDSCVPEVTSEVEQFIWRPGNQSRRNLKQVIIVRNTSGRSLHGVVHFVFDGLSESVQGGSSPNFFRTRCAQPLGRRYTSLGLPNTVWLPGQEIQLEVDFFNPERVQVDYRLRIYTGPGRP